MASLHLQNYIINRDNTNKLFVSKPNGFDKTYIGKSSEIMCIKELDNGELIFIKKTLDKESIVHYFDSGTISYTGDKINKILPNIYLLSNEDYQLLYNVKTKNSLKTTNFIKVDDNQLLLIENIKLDNFSDTIIKVIDQNSLKIICIYSTLQQRQIDVLDESINNVLKNEIYKYLYLLNNVDKVETREEVKTKEALKKIRERKLK